MQALSEAISARLNEDNHDPQSDQATPFSDALCIPHEFFGNAQLDFEQSIPDAGVPHTPIVRDNSLCSHF